jgi:hypothetical protein
MKRLLVSFLAAVTLLVPAAAEAGYSTPTPRPSISYSRPTSSFSSKPSYSSSRPSSKPSGSNFRPATGSRSTSSPYKPVRAGGKTYTPKASLPTYKTPAGGYVPRVALPSSVHYYATLPPSGRYVRVYDPILGYLVWISVIDAQSHGWYTQNTGTDLTVLWIVLLIVAVVGVVGGAYAFTRRI